MGEEWIGSPGWVWTYQRSAKGWESCWEQKPWPSWSWDDSNGSNTVWKSWKKNDYRNEKSVWWDEPLHSDDGQCVVIETRSWASDAAETPEALSPNLPVVSSAGEPGGRIVIGKRMADPEMLVNDFAAAALSSKVERVPRESLWVRMLLNRRHVGFELAPALIGRSGQNLKPIAQQTNTTVRVCRIGSRFLEVNGVQEARGPLMVVVTAKRRQVAAFRQAVSLVIAKLEEVNAAFEKFRVRHGLADYTAEWPLWMFDEMSAYAEHVLQAFIPESRLYAYFDNYFFNVASQLLDDERKKTKVSSEEISAVETELVSCAATGPGKVCDGSMPDWLPESKELQLAGFSQDDFQSLGNSPTCHGVDARFAVESAWETQAWDIPASTTALGSQDALVSARHDHFDVDHGASQSLDAKWN